MIGRRRFMSRALGSATVLTLGPLLGAAAQTPARSESLASFLSSRLPPTERSFREIVDAYLAHPQPAQMLLALTQLHVGTDPRSFDVAASAEGSFKKLAETLLLWERLLRDAEGDIGGVVRRAYQHYIINTAGPLPSAQSADDFDVAQWATEYAAEFQMSVRHDPDGRETLMTIDDPERPVRFRAWRNQEWQSSAASLRSVGQLINRRRYGRDDVISSRLFEFDPRARGHSKANAIWLAELSQLVYLREPYVRRQLAGWGYQNVHWIDSDEDTQVVLATQSDHVVISFRGTESGKDFLTDLKFRKRPFGLTPDSNDRLGEVHRGFQKALDSAWNQIVASLEDIEGALPVFVCGHSLGAALAQLAALRLGHLGRNIGGVYVFGSPRVGDAAFREAYRASLGKQTFLHANNKDIVTTVPPRWIGYEHVSDTIRRFDDNHTLTIEGLSELAVRAPADTETATRELMQKVQQSLSNSSKYLAENDLTLVAGPRLTYSAEHEEGRLDDHGVAQYLFKFACAVVDEQMKARN